MRRPRCVRARSRRRPSPATLCASALAAVFAAGACERPKTPEGFKPRMPKVIVTSDEPGTGVEASDGRTVTAHYIGVLPDGETFVSTYDDGRPHAWTIGADSVIAGMDEAVRGMRAGGKRTVIIPPELHWGREGYGGVVPPNARLTFEIMLIQVQ